MAHPESKMKILERRFVCPERLLDDEARNAAALDFVEYYGSIYPKSPMGERLSARERLMKTKHCKYEQTEHTLPEL